MFFVPFILITSFAVLNLFIGIIVDAMQRFDDDANGQDPSKNVPQQDDNTIGEIQALKTEIQELKQLIQKINTG
jgi:voltage-gated sodium channel